MHLSKVKKVFLQNQSTLPKSATNHYHLSSSRTMKFSTSSIFYMAALIATTLSPNSAVVSARPLLQKDKSSKNKSTMTAATVSSSPQLHVPSSSSSSSAPFFPSLEGGHLTLFGLDPNEPLTLDEAAFLEETIRDVFNKIHKENDIDLVASSVSIMQDMIGGNGNDGGNRSLLRGSMGNSRRRPSGRKLPSDREMCEYAQDGDGYSKGDIIPGCTFEIEWYMDCYCHVCDDDNPPNDTRTPSTSPSSAPVHFDFFRFLDDDDDDGYDAPNDNGNGNGNGNDNDVFTQAPTPAPFEDNSSDEDNDVSIEVERGPIEPSDFDLVPVPVFVPVPTPIENETRKKLNKSRFHYFKRVTGVRFGNLHKFRGGN